MMMRFLALALMLLVVACTARKSVPELSVTSTTFSDGGMIPAKYTCTGDDINPPIDISNVPAAAQSLALIMDDPDAPGGTWVHWVMWDFTGQIAEDSAPGTEGTNSWGNTNYGGPCPPSGTHRYVFKVYALDTKLNLPATTTKKDLERAMEGHIITQGQLIGRYAK
jgi:Raf kinase inhibitor-like YbhB/YbcL family protein